MRATLFIVAIMSFANVALCNAAGVQIGRTRIIYDASAKEAALTLVNKETELPWLVQSWTDTGDEKTRGPFIVTPPLFRLDAQKEQSLRITWTGAPLPTDRESLFYMNIRTIPAVEKTEDHKNVLRLIYKTRLKMFWRPKGLEGTSEEACKNLHFTFAGDQLSITNKGDFYSVFDSLWVNKTKIKNAELIAPKATIVLPASHYSLGSTVKWRCITDFGSASEEYTTSLSQE